MKKPPHFQRWLFALLAKLSRSIRRNWLRFQSEMDQDNPVSIHDDIKLGFRLQGHAFEINIGHPQSDFTTAVYEGLTAVLIVQPRYFVELLIRSDQFQNMMLQNLLVTNILCQHDFRSGVAVQYF